MRRTALRIEVRRRRNGQSGRPWRSPRAASPPSAARARSRLGRRRAAGRARQARKRANADGGIGLYLAAAPDAGQRACRPGAGTEHRPRDPQAGRAEDQGRDRRRTALQPPHGCGNQRVGRRLVPGAEDQASLAPVYARACFGRLRAGHPVGRSEETGHGRKETRTATLVSAQGLAEHHDFPDLKGFGRIKATRETVPPSPPRPASLRCSGCRCRSSSGPRCAPTGPSRTPCTGTSRSRSARIPRNCKANGPANIAVLRRRALDVVRTDTSRGFRSVKLRRAGWGDAPSQHPQGLRRRVPNAITLPRRSRRQVLDALHRRCQAAAQCRPYLSVTTSMVALSIL